MTLQQYEAYKTSGDNVTGANQIPALYEGCIKFMYQAKDAITKKDYESRFNNVNKVCNIIAGLRDCLNFEEVPDVAKVLDDYYAMIDYQLLTLQSNDSEELCDQIISSIKQMHGAWKDVASEHNKAQNVGEDENLKLSEEAKVSISADSVAAADRQARLDAQEVEVEGGNEEVSPQSGAIYSAYQSAPATLADAPLLQKEAQVSEGHNATENNSGFSTADSKQDYDLRDLNI